MTKWLLFARWSEIDQHFELVNSFDTEEAASKEGDKLAAQGAVAFRIERRELPAKKGKKHDEDDE